MRASRGFQAHPSSSPFGLSPAAGVARPRHWLVRSPLASAMLAAGLLGAAVVLPTPVWAQAAAAKPSAALHQFDVPAGPLNQALAQFGTQAGIALAGDVALTQGKHTAGLRGQYTASQGLHVLLQGTDIQAQPDASGRSFILSAVASLPEVQITASVEGGTPLPEVLVTATPSGATENTGSYTQTGPSRAATGLPLTLRETPQSVSVMTRQRMDDFKLNTLTDVLEQTPGVTIDRQGDATHFMVRGSNVNLQVNGMRQMASGWAVDAQKFYSMDDMVEIDRIEVLKGSSGLMNGDGNYGGTVNMIRKRPTKDFKASVGMGFGSWQNVRGDVDVGGPLNASGTVRGRVVAAGSDGHDFRDYVQRKNQTLFGALEVDLTPNTLLNVDLTYRHRDYQGAAETSMIQAYNANGEYLGLQPRSFNSGAPWSGFEQNTRSVFANLEHQFDNGWTAKLRANYEKTQNPYYESAYWWTVTPQAIDVAWTRGHYNLNHSVALDAQGPFELFGRSHEVMVGIDSGNSKSRSISGSDRLSNLDIDYAQGGAAIERPDMSAIPEDNDSVFSSKRHSAYAAARLNLADPVKLIVGARITDYQQRDETPYAYSNRDFRKHGVITPYAGVVVDVHDDVSLYGSYASIFKPQSAVDAQGQTLDPEEGNTYELGAKGEFFEKRLNASIAHFWMRTDNVAESTGELRPDGSSIYRSVSGVRRRGYELELSGELSPGWQAQGSFVMNSSTLSTNSNVPKHQFKLGTSYALDGALRGLHLGAATRWQSKTTAGPLEQTAFWVVDLMARYQVNQQWSLNFNVRNAFDKSYFAGMRDFGRVQYVWGAPRSYNVSIRYTF